MCTQRGYHSIVHFKIITRAVFLKRIVSSLVCAFADKIVADSNGHGSRTERNKKKHMNKDAKKRGKKGRSYLVKHRICSLIKYPVDVPFTSLGRSRQWMHICRHVTSFHVGKYGSILVFDFFCRMLYAVATSS